MNRSDPCPTLLRTKDTIHREGCTAAATATRWPAQVWRYAQGRTVWEVIDSGFVYGLRACQRCHPLSFIEPR